MRRLFIAAVVCAFITVPAMADFTVQETSVGPQQTMTVYSTDVSPTVNTGAYTGVYNLNVSGAGAPVTGVGIQSFCIDIHQNGPTMAGGSATYNAVSLASAPTPQTAMGATRAGQVAWLLNNQWTSPITDATKAAAIQAAVWEIVNESSGTYSVTGGNTKVTGAAATQNLANGWLTTINGMTTTNWATYSTANYAALVSGTYQDYVVKVPLPGAVLLGALGLIAAGRKLRKLA